MPRNNRKLAFPRAFSIMASERMGKVIDLLRVIASTKTQRVSAGDVTRRLLAKGMLVETCEYAQGYATGLPVDLTARMLADTHSMVAELAPDMLMVGRAEEDKAWSVLARMWPELSKKVDKINVQTSAGRTAHRRLQAGPPRTSQGRAKTVEQVRDEALADVQEGVKAPKVLPPPRTVAEAFEQARTQTEVDRLAISRGVPVGELLARTRSGEQARLPQADETSGATGWASDIGTRAKGREDAQATDSPEFSDAPPEQESYGQMLKRLRGEG